MDFTTADRLRTFDPYLVGGRVYPVWLSESVRFYYEATGGGADRGTFYLVDPRVGTRQAAPDTASLVDRRSEGPRWAVRSPDKQWDACVWNHDVYIRPARNSNAEFATWRAPRPSLDRIGCDAPSPPGAVVRRDSVSLPSGSIALTRGARGLAGFEFFRFGPEVAQVEAERFHLAPGGLSWSRDSKKLLAKRFGRDGTLTHQVERGAYRVSAIKRIDGAARQIYFSAHGVEPGLPYHARLYRVNFDGTGMTLLTPEPGNNTIRPVPGAPFFLDTYSLTDTPPVTALRAADGHIVMELARGDLTALRATGWTPAEVFTVKARDGATDLWGIMNKPSNFDSTKRYPIITRVDPGPQQGSAADWVFKGADSYVGTKVETTRGGRTVGRVTAGEGMGRSLAELGFIVIQLDAMGSSPLRSKAFHDVLYGHVGDNGLPDYVEGIRQLAARHLWIDTTRVGIVGHSGGGYTAAAAMLHYPDFFKVGVSQSGNHDFRVYGWYWGEKYQGLDKRQGASDNYEAEANYKYAQNLKGHLLLTTGDMDCNNPAADTLRLVDALEKAGKDFDFLLLTDTGHQPPTYAIKRVWDYFVRHLLGATPPTDYRMIPP